MARSATAVGYFDALAPTYAARYGVGGGLWHRHFFGSRRDIALRWLDEVTDGYIVDVGAGPGPLTAALAARGVGVVACDRAPAMAQQAASRGASAVVADALHLPVRSARASAAVALGLASYVDDLPALLAELRRAVRPGGLVVVSVAVATSPDWALRRLLRGAVSRTGARGVLTSGVALHTRTRSAWRAAAAAAGLALEAERGHDFTLFPLSRLFPGPSVALSRAVEALATPALAPWSAEVVLRLRVPGPALHVPRARYRPRVVRAIARLNVGGPALHTILLTRGLESTFATTLATGTVSAGEIEATHLLERYAVQPCRIRGLGRAPALADDVRAFAALLGLLRRVRPDIVHTHTAKAGAIGRVAARIAGVPHVVHTFHGHVLDGYFGPRVSRLVAAVERALSRWTERAIAVSDEVADDLVRRHRVVPAAKMRVIRVGLPLQRLADLRPADRAAARVRLGLAETAPVAVFLGRLVPVKEPDLALDVWRRVRERFPEAVLLVVGGGPLLASLRAEAPPGVRFLGWQEDVAPALAASDLALLTSRNEGTPVALIEAAAAGLPAVATAVGGVPSVVEDGRTGLLAPRGAAAVLAEHVTELLADGDRRAVMGAAAREKALAGWSDERLLDDLRALYSELLRGRSGGQNS